MAGMVKDGGPVRQLIRVDGRLQVVYDDHLSRQAEWDSIIKLEHEVLRLKRAADQYALSGGGVENVQAQYEAAKAELEARKAAFGKDGA